jgi:hypothetical protein
MLNGKELSKPIIDGKSCNAMIDGVEVWGDNEPVDYIEIVCTASGVPYLKNQWSQQIKYSINDSEPILAPQDGTDVTLNTGDTLRIYESVPGETFRGWANPAGNGGLIHNSDTCRVDIMRMPPMNKFTTNTDGTVLGNNAFRNFARGCLINIHNGFDTSELVTIHDGAFWDFGWYSSIDYIGRLESLPFGSFRFNNLTLCGNNTFQGFLNHLTGFHSLPPGSFNFPSLSAVGDNFCRYFNESSTLTSLPAGSFQFPGLVSAGNWFFGNFNLDGRNLKYLPENSFRFPLLTTVGTDAFHDFNVNGSIMLLPEGSFRFPLLDTAGIDWCISFNNGGDIYCLGQGTFYTPLLPTVSGAYRFFNAGGGKLSRGDESATITNISGGDMTFYYWSGSNGSYQVIIPNGSSMGYYGCTEPTSEYIELTVTEPGNIGIMNQWRDRDIIVSVTGLPTRAFSYWWDPGWLNIGDTIRIYESHPGVTFRNWLGDDREGIIWGGALLADLTHMPPMNSFTTSSDGTVLGWCAFKHFLRGPIVNVVNGGFDTSNIDELHDNAFYGLCRGAGGRMFVSNLGEGNFNFNNVVTAGSQVFCDFMRDQDSLTSLPAGSFCFPDLTVTGFNFCMSFARSCDLSNIPMGSFNTPSLAGHGDNFYEYLFYKSKLRIDNSNFTWVTNNWGMHIYIDYYNGTGNSQHSLPVGSSINYTCYY